MWTWNNGERSRPMRRHDSREPESDLQGHRLGHDEISRETRRTIVERLSPGLQTLLGEPAFCQVATLLPDGSPHLTQVWVNTDGEHVLVNTYEGAQKLRNIRRDPRVAVNVVDPGNAWRLAQLRGRVVDVTTEGADEHIDELARKYLGVDSYPFRQPGQVRVKVTIAPEHINEIGLD
jgi:PPOX class probable F420-dependent enzyme